MKKSNFKIVLALTLTLVVVLLCGCKKLPEPEAAEGYTKYSNDYISFDYPDSWRMTTGQVEILTGGDTSNVTVAREVKSSIYRDMTEENFDILLRPSLEQAYTSVTNVQINHTQNDYQKIDVIAFDAVAYGVNLHQEMYVVRAGMYNYSVCVTTPNVSTGLNTQVFNSLYVK